MSEYWIPLAAITGWALITLYRMHVAGKAREQVHRERLAMIEKGLVPSPVADPRGFDRAVRRYDRRPGRGPHRHRSAGVTLVGVGLGLMLMIAFAGNSPQKAVGIGGFVVMLGVAFIINGMFDQRQLDTEIPSGAEPPLDPAAAPPPKAD